MIKSDIKSLLEIDFNTITKEELENLNDFNFGGQFTSILIVPTNVIHKSGYKCMKYILCDFNNVVGVIGGDSDMIHFDGIGGYGKDLDINYKRHYGFRIDCLPCGVLRLFCNYKLYCDYTVSFGLSDFTFYVSYKEK